MLFIWLQHIHRTDKKIHTLCELIGWAPASPLEWKLFDDMSCVSFAQCGDFILSAVLGPRCPHGLGRMLSGVCSRLGVWVRGLAPSVALKFLLGNTASLWPSSGMWRSEAARQGAGWPELFQVCRGKTVIPVFTWRIDNNLETVLTIVTSEKEVNGSSPCLC